MAMKSVVFSSTLLRRFMDRSAPASGRSLRYFGDSSGRILSEEERAAENVYIKRMEKERMEKQKLKAEKEKAEKEKADKKAEGGSHTG